MKLRWWPRTLFGRLVIILVGGMFSGQLLTSTIWFETHDNRTLEIPVRLFASRLADTIRLLDQAGGDAQRRDIAQHLSDDRYQLQWIDAPQAAPHQTVAHQAVVDLLAGVIRRPARTGGAGGLVGAPLPRETPRRPGFLPPF